VSAGSAGQYRTPLRSSERALGGPALRNIFDFRGIFSNINTRTIYLYSILIGLCAGLGAAAFNALLHVTAEITMTGWAQLAIPQPHGEVAKLATPTGPTRRWLLLVMPVVGGLLSGLFVRTWAPEAEGTGTDSYIEAFHNKAGAMRKRVPLIKSLATLATLSSGGSAGKEGPVAQIGAGVGSALGGFTRMGARARRTLMVAGAAGGLGAIFRAPLGGALTACEVLYKEDLETDALTPSILSSVTAYTVFCSINGFHHVFAFKGNISHAPVQLLLYVVLGLVCSGAGYLYVRFMHGSKALFFDRLPVNKYVVPPIGGLFVGLIGFFFPQAMGQGLGYVQQLIDGQPVGGTEITIGALAVLAVMKIATTSFTISSGGSGGVFAPSLFIGAMLGGCVGMLGHEVLPNAGIQMGPYVVVGMGAFFAGVANAPVASLLMVSELTGAYELLPALMIVATVALVTSRRWSIYTTQVDNKFFSRAHLWEMNPNVLKRMTVGEMSRGVYDSSSVISNDTPLRQIQEIAGRTGEHDFVLRNAGGELAGLISLSDLDLEDLEHIGSFVLAHDLINRRTAYLRPQDNLVSALELFGNWEFDKIPIVDDRGGHKTLLGHIRYQDILEFYKREHVAEPAPA
jgi:CIC family chloride channel protein